MAQESEAISHIDQDLYLKYDVKRGLRDLDGKGVRAGLTDISKVIGKKRAPTGMISPVKENCITAANGFRIWSAVLPKRNVSGSRKSRIF